MGSVTPEKRPKSNLHLGPFSMTHLNVDVDYCKKKKKLKKNTLKHTALAF